MPYDMRVQLIFYSKVPRSRRLATCSDTEAWNRFGIYAKVDLPSLRAVANLDLGGLL